jgi:hypothetical protein
MLSLAPWNFTEVTSGIADHSLSSSSRILCYRLNRTSAVSTLSRFQRKKRSESTEIKVSWLLLRAVCRMRP